MPRHGEKHTDIVPIHAARTACHGALRLWPTAELGTRKRQIIERRHDTILYRYVSILSTSDSDLYH
jgi:hypothetical protein